MRTVQKLFLQVGLVVFLVFLAIVVFGFRGGVSAVITENDYLPLVGASNMPVRNVSHDYTADPHLYAARQQTNSHLVIYRVSNASYTVDAQIDLANLPAPNAGFGSGASGAYITDDDLYVYIAPYQSTKVARISKADFTINSIVVRIVDGLDSVGSVTNDGTHLYVGGRAVCVNCGGAVARLRKSDFANTGVSWLVKQTPSSTSTSFISALSQDVTYLYAGKSALTGYYDQPLVIKIPKNTANDTLWSAPCDYVAGTCEGYNYPQAQIKVMSLANDTTNVFAALDTNPGIILKLVKNNWQTPAEGRELVDNKAMAVLVDSTNNYLYSGLKESSLRIGGFDRTSFMSSPITRMQITLEPWSMAQDQTHVYVSTYLFNSLSTGIVRIPKSDFGISTPTPTPTPTSAPVSCSKIRYYAVYGDASNSSSWSEVTNLNSIYFAGGRVFVTATANIAAGSVDRARFRVNGGAWVESSLLKPGTTNQYYYTYDFTAQSANFVFDAEVHSVGDNRWY